jgi:integrase/recombinase XerC
MFAGYMETRSFSTHTIRRRRSSLGSFAKYLDPLPLALACTDDCERFLATHRAARTRHAYRSDLSTFYAWATRRHVTKTNPAADVDPIKVPKGLPRPVPLDAVRQVCASAPTKELRLALGLAAFAGLRRAEICALTTDDVQIHADPPLLVVRSGKGNKDRIVPLHPDLAQGFRDRRIPQGKVFTFTPDHLGRIAAAHIRSCGYNLTLHALRSSFATELARVSEGNVVLVGRALGHSSPQTTMGYIGWTSDPKGTQMVAECWPRLAIGRAG